MNIINTLFPILLITSLTSCCNQEELPALMQKLKSSNTRDRSQAAWDIAKCGNKAKAAIPQLSEMLYDTNVGVQSAASYALRKIDTEEARTAINSAKKK